MEMYYYLLEDEKTMSRSSFDPSLHALRLKLIERLFHLSKELK